MRCSRELPSDGFLFLMFFSQKGESMAEILVAQVQNVFSVSDAEYRKGKRIAEKILKLLDRPKYRGRGYTTQGLTLSRNSEGAVTIKATGLKEDSVRLSPARGGKLKLGRNIQALAQHLLKDGVLMSFLIQVL